MLVTINQCVRSFGLFFYKDTKDQSLFGTIVPEKGNWITVKITI